MSTPPTPDTTTPLVTTPSPPAVPDAIKSALQQLQNLVGTWHSTNGEDSWNVMPLPQDNVTDDYILKNFAYNEETTFAEIPGDAPNRAGGYTQVANTLFYEQRVYFAPTSSPPSPVPDNSVNTLVHAENGSWLFLDITNQQAGAFPPAGAPNLPLPDGVDTLPVQPANMNVAKQMSVPHGNSILAQGAVTPATYQDTTSGTPTIPVANCIPTLVMGGAVYGNPYATDKYGPSTMNANGVESNSNINPNIKLVNYLANNQVDNYIHFSVETANGNVTNIPFEQGHADVVSYSQDIWVLNPTTDPVLMYTQNITIDMTLVSSTSSNFNKVRFPHITCNVLTKV